MCNTVRKKKTAAYADDRKWLWRQFSVHSITLWPHFSWPTDVCEASHAARMRRPSAIPVVFQKKEKKKRKKNIIAVTQMFREHRRTKSTAFRLSGRASRRWFYRLANRKFIMRNICMGFNFPRSSFERVNTTYVRRNLMRRPIFFFWGGGVVFFSPWTFIASTMKLLAHLFRSVAGSSWPCSTRQVLRVLAGRTETFLRQTVAWTSEDESAQWHDCWLSCDNYRSRRVSIRTNLRLFFFLRTDSFPPALQSMG